MIKQLIEKELELLNEKAISYGRYKQGHITYGKFVLEYMESEAKSSIKNPEEFVMDWLIDQKTNDLPITSSGSTLNAILDEDGLINALEEGAYFIDEILSFRCKEYISDEIKDIRTGIRNRFNAWNADEPVRRMYLYSPYRLRNSGYGEALEKDREFIWAHNSSFTYIKGNQ